MKNILDWLEENVDNDDVNFDGEPALEQQAEIIRAKAEAAGYLAADLYRACGGGIAEYLRNRRREAVGENTDGKLAGDASPGITPGFNQQ
ncbi:MULTISPECIES: hypothetical protein [unclassified Rhizobium]|uniref:hypothetical protein n=1 Tax=unclassified Rhizobium TaxID=2613769 RepID=UPI001620F835|nr:MULTISPECIES: hypothetical protein [unclassified Rhizobium]MBB3318720.1 hypothetical protein [Rhizobium sp. BK181]MBB3543053.1 hypothetical protein [Rhizobium sp. BK399]MCS3742269.1 hypothetical protein [Rhizobium sp. BK661]MCS4094903.1 hypothetical protein [Rhizobium sp. BK176]